MMTVASRSLRVPLIEMRSGKAALASRASLAACCASVACSASAGGGAAAPRSPAAASPAVRVPSNIRCRRSSWSSRWAAGIDKLWMTGSPLPGIIPGALRIQFACASASRQRCRFAPSNPSLRTANGRENHGRSNAMVNLAISAVLPRRRPRRIGYCDPLSNQTRMKRHKMRFDRSVDAPRPPGVRGQVTNERAAQLIPIHQGDRGDEQAQQHERPREGSQQYLQGAVQKWASYSSLI